MLWLILLPKNALVSGGNILDVDGVIALSHLDSMIDRVRQYRQSACDPLAFLVSTGMISKISGLQTRISPHRSDGRV